MPDLSTQDAQAQNLPLSDVYRFSHLLYRDELNRDMGVVKICYEAMAAFEDTIIIARRQELKAEIALLDDFGKKDPPDLSKWPDTPWSSQRSLLYNLENVKLASGMEMMLKAALVEADIIIQQIDQRAPAYKHLAKEQRTRPITKGELFGIDGYRFDGKSNYLPGLKTGTINFSTIIQEPAYRAVTGCSDTELGLIDEMRELRNQIHFPGDVYDSPKLQALGNGYQQFLFDFVNRHVVDKALRLQSKHGRNNHRFFHL